MQTGQIRLNLPSWLLQQWQQASQQSFLRDEDKMALVLRVTRENMDRGGGPFGAAIFDRSRHQLISLGANRVIPSGCSLWHAETVAIAAAQHAFGRHDLGNVGPLELITSCEPCCMCLGALLWSGVKRVVCGARDADARAIGFDEGPKPEDWVGVCHDRGIEVQRDVNRVAANKLLERYAQTGGTIYNG